MKFYNGQKIKTIFNEEAIIKFTPTDEYGFYDNYGICALDRDIKTGTYYKDNVMIINRYISAEDLVNIIKKEN